MDRTDCRIIVRTRKIGHDLLGGNCSRFFLSNNSESIPEKWEFQINTWKLQVFTGNARIGLSIINKDVTSQQRLHQITSQFKTGTNQPTYYIPWDYTLKRDYKTREPLLILRHPLLNLTWTARFAIEPWKTGLPTITRFKPHWTCCRPY